MLISFEDLGSTHGIFWAVGCPQRSQSPVGTHLETINIGALIIRLGFWDTVHYNPIQEPPPPAIVLVII